LHPSPSDTDEAAHDARNETQHDMLVIGRLQILAQLPKQIGLEAAMAPLPFSALPFSIFACAVFLFRAKRDLTDNLPGLPAVFPDVMAPAVQTAPDVERELSMMRWGFPPPPNLSKVPVTNVRNVTSPYRRGWLMGEA
jgi:hypothetical protein